jgi:CMP-N,N'-diacetyllegionaminic acid synthase
MILGHIGARKGSKGVVGKNFRPIAGKPLIDWSLDQLFRNENIDAVVVSTDDPEVYEHGLKRGALDIGLRPEKLATDDASKWNVWQHSLNVAEEKLGPVTAFLDLDCTSPLREDKDIDCALALFKSEAPDMVMSCCVARKNPYFNMVEVNDAGSLQVSKPLPGNVVARQHAPTVYEHVGLVYVISPNYLRSASFLYDGHVVPYVVPTERSLDIDTEFDFKIVEFLMKEKHQ